MGGGKREAPCVGSATGRGLRVFASTYACVAWHVITPPWHPTMTPRRLDRGPPPRVPHARRPLAVFFALHGSLGFMIFGIVFFAYTDIGCVRACVCACVCGWVWVCVDPWRDRLCVGSFSLSRLALGVHSRVTRPNVLRPNPKPLIPNPKHTHMQSVLCVFPVCCWSGTLASRRCLPPCVGVSKPQNPEPQNPERQIPVSPNTRRWASTQGIMVYGQVWASACFIISSTAGLLEQANPQHM